MTLAEVNAMLTGITGYANRVAYLAFPEGEAPQLPFICYFVENSDNFGADNEVYFEVNRIAIELYTKYKSPADETLVENALKANSIYWEKEETYLSDERCFEVIYHIEV